MIHVTLIDYGDLGNLSVLRTFFNRAMPRPQNKTEYEIVAAEFDAVHYKSASSDLSNDSIDLIQHFIDKGWREGRDPAPWFSTQDYLDANPDIAENGVNPFYHYLCFGRGEGRPTQPSAAHIRQVVSTAFDPKFYVGAYPALRGHEDPIQDFLDSGWKEGRDPNPDFSTDYYLSAHGDVRESGINPFYHYLKFGYTEGRAVQPSTRVVAESDPLSADASDETKRVRTAVVALVKNEIDIIETFLSHLLALFDVIVIIDHNSNDGTREVIDAVAASHSSLRVYSLDEPAYLQALVMNHVVRTYPEINDVDWLFLLDADEFLPFGDRESFDIALRAHSKHPVIAMNWANAVPDPYWTDKVEFSDQTQLLIPSKPSHYCKIGFQPSRVNRDRVWISQGNHSLQSVRNGCDLEAVPAGFSLIHLPVRSRNQILLKLNQGVLSYLQLNKGREKLEGSHWFRLQKALKNKTVTDELLNSVVATYGEQGQDLAPMTTQNLRDSGYSKAAPDFAMRRFRVRPDLAQARLDDPGELLFRHGAEVAEVADSMRAARSIDAASPETEASLPVTELETTADGTIRRAKSDIGCQFLPLPCADELENTSVYDDQFRFLTAFLKPTYWEIDNLTPTAWGGHIPFLFALTALEHPRRYVELGTHNGASFLAYCQAANRLNIDTHPVAIDTWSGDEHAGFYDNGVFNRFTHLLRKYKDFASFLRMRFEDAAPRFAEGSVDLLHIDGLHTYEAVRDDYETWLPKMSDRGIILFHDTNVHERDFGVWRFWEEVKERHPTIELRHSHGLGVAYVGDRQDRGIVRVMDLMRDEPSIAMLIQQHLEEVGQSSPERFIANYELRQREAQGQSVAQLHQEIGKLKQALTVAESEREELRRMVASRQR